MYSLALSTAPGAAVGRNEAFPSGVAQSCRVYERDDEDLVPQVVEDDEGVGDGEEGLGDAEIVRRGVGELLQVAYGVVGEEADGAAYEGREVRQGRHALLAQDLGEPPERVGRRYLAHPVGVHDGKDAIPVGERPLRVEA
jgi:hypothetical protein